MAKDKKPESKETVVETVVETKDTQSASGLPVKQVRFLDAFNAPLGGMSTNSLLSNSVKSRGNYLLTVFLPYNVLKVKYFPQSRGGTSTFFIPMSQVQYVRLFEGDDEPKAPYKE